MIKIDQFCIDHSIRLLRNKLRNQSAISTVFFIEAFCINIEDGLTNSRVLCQTKLGNIYHRRSYKVSFAQDMNSFYNLQDKR